MRIGLGYDIHQLVTGRKLILGGVDIPFDKGLLGHSDADVLVHAVCDALLGAACLGDIGMLFPDTDPEYKDIDSMKLLIKTYDLLKENGYSIINIDATVSAEAPKLSSYREEMRGNISKVLHTDSDSVNVKFTTSEGLGFVGKGEGINAMCIALIEKRSRKE